MTIFKGAINLNRSRQTWTVTDSFRAAYLSWDRTNNLATSQLERERYFDYGEFPFQEFYSLIIETNRQFQTQTWEQKTTIGLKINKNPFFVSGEGIDSLTFTAQNLSYSVLPSPYLSKDFISKKNYLGLFIEHEIALSDRLVVNFEGTFDLAIADTTDLPEISAIESIENNNFYPELSLDYELSDRIVIFTKIDYARESIEEIDVKNQSFNSEIYQGLEIGIETKLSNNWIATLSWYRETQHNITTIDPKQPDFDLQINEQISNSWTGEVKGEIIPSWWLYGFYSYTDAKVTQDEAIEVGNTVGGIARHRGGVWTSYESSQGVWKGLGFGSGITWNGDHPENTANNVTLPGYLQTDAAIFYSQDNWKAAISIQNLFNAGIKDDEVVERSLFGTVWFQF